MLRVALTFVLVLASVVSGVQRVAAQEDTATARRLFRQGVQAFDRGQFARALSLFEQSYQARESQLVLYNLAVTERRLGRDEVALTHLYEWMWRNGGEGSPRRGEVEGVIGELAPRLATLRFERRPEATTIRVDGSLLETSGDGVAAIRPGVYTLRFEAEGYEAEERQVTLEAGSDETMQVSLSEAAAVASTDVPPDRTHPNPQDTPPPEESGGLLFTWIAGGLTLALAGLGVGAWIAGDAEFSNLQDTCAPDCSDDQVSTLHTWDLLTNIGFIGAGVMGALTIVLALVELDAFGGDDESPTQSLLLGPGSVAYRTRF